MAHVVQPNGIARKPTLLFEGGCSKTKVTGLNKKPSHRRATGTAKSKINHKREQNADTNNTALDGKCILIKDSLCTVCNGTVNRKNKAKNTTASHFGPPHHLHALLKFSQ